MVIMTIECIEWHGSFKTTGVRKPNISEPLKDVSVQEGKGVRLECHYTGEPAPQVQWLRNQQPVMPSTVFKVNH